MLIDSEKLRSELRRVRLTDCSDPDAVVLSILAKCEKDQDEKTCGNCKYYDKRGNCLHPYDSCSRFEQREGEK